MLVTKFYFLTQILVGLILNVSAYRENILLIVADDLRPSIGVYGDRDAVTPNIDYFANSGVTFVQAYAQQALCAPSRNSFLTSRRPDTLHLYDFYSYWRTFAGNFTTLPQYFKENDYYTKSIGKIFHPGKSSNYTDDYPYSWSELPWHPSAEKYKNSPVCMTGSKLYANLVCPVTVADQPEGTLPDIQSLEEAIKFLESRQNDVQSFFLAVGFHKPHIPLKFPKEYLDYHPIKNVSLPIVRNYPPSLPTIAWNPWNDIRKRDDIAALNISFPFSSIPDDWVRKIRQAYFSSVTYIDDLIGRLLFSLEMLELHKNTIIVLLGDHGWSLGEHGEWSKYSNLDIATQVPLIFNVPNSFNGGKKVWDPVELVDLFPTLVDLVGLKAIPKCPTNSTDIILCTEGKSLAPHILSEIDSSKKLEKNMYVKGKYSLSQYPRPGVEPTKTPDSDKPHMKDIKFMGYSIRTPRHRYTQWISWDSKTLSGNWTDINQTELYDHHIDPDENLNLAGRPGLEELEADLSKLLREGFSN